MKNALNNQVGMLGDMFLWLLANLKQGVIYFIKQACGNEIMPSVYFSLVEEFSLTAQMAQNWKSMLEIGLGNTLLYLLCAFNSVVR